MQAPSAAARKGYTFNGRTHKVIDIQHVKLVVANYQRELNHPWVQELVANWDELSSGVPLLNDRKNNTYAIINGQQRIERAHLAKQRYISVEIINIPIGEENEKFVRCNKTWRMHPLTKFWALYRAKTGGALEKLIFSMVKKSGLAMAQPGKGLPDINEINAVGALYQVYRIGMENSDKPHDHLIADTLRVIVGAFSLPNSAGVQPTALQYAFIMAIGRVMARGFSVEQAVARLGRHTPKGLVDQIVKTSPFHSLSRVRALEMRILAIVSTKQYSVQ